MTISYPNEHGENITFENFTSDMPMIYNLMEENKMISLHILQDLNPVCGVKGRRAPSTVRLQYDGELRKVHFILLWQVIMSCLYGM